MSTTLDVWVSSGSLQRHATGPQEVAELLAIVERDLAESQTAGLSSDWQLTIAYNAALQAAKAALAAAGYRVSAARRGIIIDSSSRCATRSRHRRRTSISCSG